jgi:hypothetical protein
LGITRRQLGRLAAVGAGALVLPGLLPPRRAAATVPPAGTWGDQGDSTYVNPTLPGDFSDWDCIRGGSDYYGITSPFGYSPGMAVLHSMDLVNQRSLGGAVDDVTRIGPELNRDRMNRYGRGVWAGALRFHAGRYWLYFNTPDEDFFMTSAPSPAGPVRRTRTAPPSSSGPTPARRTSSGPSGPRGTASTPSPVSAAARCST